jgi:hypothetical protein
MAEIWGAALAVAGAVGGAYISSQGAKKAGQAQAGASEAAIAEQRRQFDLLRGDQAPYQQAGVAALNQLMQLYGLGGVSGGSNLLAGAAPVTSFAPPRDDGFFNTGAGAGLNPATVSSRLGSAGKILDPAYGLFGNLFGNKHGDEKRNLQAFAKESGVMQLPDGRLALPDGRVFNESQLQDVAGAWYGATYAPDGNQEQWQGTLDRLLGGPAPINATRDANGTWVPTPGGGVEQRLALGDPSAGTGAPAAPDYSSFFMSPDYQFALDQGEQAILRNRSATGGLASGNTLAALTQYGQGLASQQYGNYVNRLAAIAGIGQTANQATGAAGIATGQGIADSLIAGGNARASGIVGSNNAWADALGTIGGVAWNRFRPQSSLSNTYSYNTYGRPAGAYA